MDWTIRSATRDDTAELAGVFARAFYGDDAMRWMLPDHATRALRLERMFAATLRWLCLYLGATEAAVRDGPIAANVPLYERFGFRVTQEIALPRGAPTHLSMWRGPARG